MPTPPAPSVSRAGSPLPRLLLLGWALWLLVSWVLNLALVGPPGLLTDAPFDRNAEAFVPAIQGMMTSAWIGLALIWPAARLSQPTPRYPTQHTLLDLLCLLSVLFAVMATLMIVVGWSPLQVGVLIAMFTGYSMWIAAWVDLGRRRAGVGRAAAMGLCGLTAGGAWMLAVDEQRLVTLMFTPVTMLRVLSRSVAPLDLPAGLAIAGVLAGAGLTLWTVTAAWLAPNPSRPREAR